MCYDFKIRKGYGDGVVVEGFPEVHYGMGIDDLKKLRKVIDDYLEM